MKFKGKKVLVLDGGSRQVLPILSGLHDIGCEISCFSSTKMDNGYCSRFVDNKLLVKWDEYHEMLGIALREIKSRQYDVLIPLTDNSMNIITKHQNEFGGLVRLPIPSRDVYLKAFNKQVTMEICMDNGIPCPITKYENETVDDFINKVGFPIIAKPRMAWGSVGLKIIKNREQLDELISNGSIKLDEYVLQEFIPQTGKQYNIHLFMDDNGTLCSGLVTEKTRWYPVDGGASCLCRTLNDSETTTQCEKLLKCVGWRSYCEIEMIVDPRDNIKKVMEINGRASASIKIMSLAGINVAEQMMQLAYDQPVTVYKEVKEDIRMRRIATDILWLFQSKDRFTRKPSWFSPVRTHEVIFSIRDPLPFFASGLKLVTRATKLKTEMSIRGRD